MNLPDPLELKPVAGPIDATVHVPGSKSITNRALVCAALANGVSRLRGALFADDTAAMQGALRSLGISVEADEANHELLVHGSNGQPPAGSGTIDVRQSGTTARFVLPLAALAHGHFRIDGHLQMLARPMGPTFSALRELGVAIEELTATDHLPATVQGGRFDTAVLRVAGDESSQFLSGLLLVAPCLPEGLVIELSTRLVSRPYVELTLAVMRSFGAAIDTPDDATFIVHPSGYSAREYAIEPDASAASYPLAAAAICGGRVTVAGLGDAAVPLQGDAAFADVLGAMGAEVSRDSSGTTVIRERPLIGGRFDLTHISDTAQTLAAVAVFASSPVQVDGIGFIRHKETDRVAAVVTELHRCGISVTELDDGWLINGGRPRPTVIQTYDDHRMAMSFALLGLRCPGIAIANPGCVAKTFPGYFTMLESLRPAADGPARPVGVSY